MNRQVSQAGLVLIAALSGLFLGRLPISPLSDQRPAANLPAPVPPASIAEAPSAGALLSDFFGTAATDVKDLRPLASRIETVIATVPDWVDSHARWMFDSRLAALERAAGSVGYILDRFILPDWPRPRPNGAAIAHHGEPGVVLFRRQGDAGIDLFLAFLVAETPTEGIHKAALYSAIESIVRLGSDAPKSNCLKILGPSFSGTSTSLRIALERLPQQLKDRVSDVRIVTGGASVFSNKEILESEDADLPIRFSSTVLPDSVIVKQLVEYLKRTGQAGGRIALLVESNTAYGSGMLQNWKEAGIEPMVITFPLHISRLRNAAEQSPGPLPPGERTVPLRLGTSYTPTDRLPVVAPETTHPQVELVLRSLVKTVQHEGITAIGLMATDTRDKLFLAREVARRLPNVTKFTLEADLLYAHPDFSPFTRGMIVAGSYPLAAVNPLRSGQDSEVEHWIQFPNQPTQGFYNALLALICHQDGGEPACGDGLPRMTGYVSRISNSDRWIPPIWISMTAKGGLWPLDIVEYDELDGDSSEKVKSYVFAQIAEQRQISARLRPSSVSIAAFFILTLLVLAHSIAFLIAKCPPSLKDHPLRAFRWLAKTSSACRNWWFVRWFRSPIKFALEAQDIRQRLIEHRRFLLLCFLILATVLIILSFLFGLWISSELWSPHASGELPRSLRTMILIGTGFLLVFLAWLSLAFILAWIVFQTEGLFRLQGRGEPRLLLFGVIFLFVVRLVVLTYLDWGTELPSSSSDSFWMLRFLFERSTHPSNWASPAFSLLLILCSLYLFAAFHLSRLTRSGLSIPKHYQEAFLKLAPAKTPWLRLRELVVKPMMQGLPVSALLLVILLAVMPKLILNYRMASSENYWLSRLMGGASLTSQILIILLLVYLLLLWARTRVLLRQLASRPIAEAFFRLPKSLWGDPIAPMFPRIGELGLFVRQANMLAFSRWAPRKLQAEARKMQDAFEADSESSDLIGTKTWTAYLGVSSLLIPRLEARWRSSVRTAKEGEQDQRDLWHHKAEELVAAQLVFSIRALLNRLLKGIQFLMCAQILLLAGHLFIPFRHRQLLVSMDWLYLLLVIGALVTVFIQMDRNELVCRISSREPGQIHWSREFVFKLFAYGVVPLTAMFAAHFPELGSSMTSWLNTFNQVMPIM